MRILIISTAYSQITTLNPTHPLVRNSKFHKEVASWLQSSNITFHQHTIDESPFPIISLGKEGDSYKVGLHIIPTPKTSRIPPNLCKQLTDDSHLLPFETIIHLHQDVWNNKNEIVKARIAARVNFINQRWYARKTTLKRINIVTAMEFLENHHLWGATRAKVNYGLFDKGNDELIAVATFSPRRHVKRGDVEGGDGSSRPYRSHELIRYCSKRDGRAVGGITKLIAGFCRDFAPDDLVTCIDRDWGDGRGWLGIGFEKVNVMPPLLMAVGDDGVRRYLVGAGIGHEEKNRNSGSGKNDRNGRPGISFELYQDLDGVVCDAEALECITSRNLYPVYDSGVERRMLLVNKSKLEAKASLRREELGLEEIDSPRNVTALGLWMRSKPSFPPNYYSKNTGINALLERAKQCDEAPVAFEKLQTR